jgi:conserved oligomeric Golgi complex subunit 5
LQNVRTAYEHIVDPLLAAIRRDLAAIIAKLHRIDFGQSDPMAGMNGTSLYMKDLVEKLSFIKVEILSKFNVGTASRAW